MAKTYRTRIAHGHTVGKKYHPLYTVWAQMISRCSSPTARGYVNYGGRGISVCDRWRTSFPHFLADIGNRPTPQHTLDRINVNGNYEPGNCRWATPKEQARNKRDNRLITYNGETLCLAEWAERIGGTISHLRTRIKFGWTPEEIITTPINRKLTPDIVAIIKSRHNESGAALAREFGVTRGTIYHIRKGRIFTNV